MTNKQQIEMARNHLKNGNEHAYIRLMKSMLRASMSTRTTNQIHKALADDNMRDQVCDEMLGEQLAELFCLND